MAYRNIINAKPNSAQTTADKAVGLSIRSELTSGAITHNA